MSNKSIYIKRSFTVITLIVSYFCCNGQAIAGKKLNELANLTLTDSTITMLTMPGQFSSVVIGVIDSVYYEVRLDADSRVDFISSGDERFETSEGVKVGDTYKSLMKRFKLSKSQVIKLPGWGYIIKLKSGWYAVFDFSEPVEANSPILFFFQQAS